MKLTFFKKNIIKIIFSIIISSLLLQLTICDIKLESKSKKAECSISSIHMPIGSSSPVMVYNAKHADQTWRITVLDREQFNELNVEGDLFYTDKATEESWFTAESIDDKAFESLKDAFSLCKQLNSETKKQKDQLKTNKDYEELRTEKLPSFIAKRSNLNRTVETEENRKVKINNTNNKNSTHINEKESDNHSVKSFLQIQTFNMLSNSEFSDLEDKIEKLETDNFDSDNDSMSLNEADKVQKNIESALNSDSKKDEYKKQMFMN